MRTRFARETSFPEPLDASRWYAMSRSARSGMRAPDWASLPRWSPTRTFENLEGCLTPGARLQELHHDGERRELPGSDCVDFRDRQADAAPARGAPRQDHQR